MYRRKKFVENIFLFISIVLVLLFGIWWFTPQHIPHNFKGYANSIDILLFLLVSYIIWHPIVMEILAWTIASHIKNIPKMNPQPGLKVAFLTTIVPSKESLDLLHKCLPAMVKATYTHDTWLLDEENNPTVQDICKKYHVNYYSRCGKDEYNTEDGKFKKNTKGGNHNSWYEDYGNMYDIVAQIDTDYVPKRSFLTKTLGYFRDPRVAFVGTPQIYANTNTSLIAKGAAEQAFNFYGTILRGLSGMGMALLIGANHVVRVSALKDVDHYSAHITEDLLTGMKFHAKGWKSVYVPDALAYGEGPTTWRSYFSQQMRWAYGCIDILFHHSPFLFRRMNLRRTIYYFFLQQHYFSGVLVALSTLLLGLYFFAGINSSRVGLLPFLFFYLPVIGVCFVMSLWFQRYNVRPKEEKGLFLAGAIVNIASWPIFCLAFLSVLIGKRLTYKVTPKGADTLASSDNDVSLFTPHILFGGFAMADIASSFFTHRQNILMLYWAVTTAFFMLSLPTALSVISFVRISFMRLKKFVSGIYLHNQYFEFRTDRKEILPQSPIRKEKYLYINTKTSWISLFSLISFSCVSVSTFFFLKNNPLLWPLYFYFGLTCVYFLISIITFSYKSFDIKKHKEIKDKWRDYVKSTSVDIFLPTAGEEIDVLENTWKGIKELITYYRGKATVYALDDSDRNEVRLLAQKYGYCYAVRSNRGEYKKAGNLRYGFKISSSDFIAIFDADFRPRRDLLYELLPYFYENPTVGIVQSPQYFDVKSEQNWLERGAGAVQEFFYRYSQMARQNHDASICVGTNAVYRRAALNEIGGTALIEHSEDVHTGFNLRMKGWTIQYVPIILAKGLCPSDMNAFFKQQYRWCRGSMSLMFSRKFWTLRLSPIARLCYIAGFFYYIHTAITSLIVPVIPLSLILLYPHEVSIFNYYLIIPSIILVSIVYPLWHIATYGIEAWATRSVYGWAHLFAIFDTLRNKSMTWQATGGRMGKDYRYIIFRIFQYVFNFLPALIWVSLSAKNVFLFHNINFIPLLISGLYYLAMISKVTFYLSGNLKIIKRESKISTNVGIFPHYGKIEV